MHIPNGRRHPPSIANLPRPRPQAYNALGERRRLLELGLAANSLDLALDVSGIVLGGIRLDLDRRLLDHILRLLQAEARDAANDLDARNEKEVSVSGVRPRESVIVARRGAGL